MKMDKLDIWKLVHIERAAMADTLEGLSPSQWAERSLCAGWPVKVAAAHILAGAELTRVTFIVGLTRTGFRFNTMMDRDARRLSRLPATEIIERLRARTATTNGPGAPPAVLLGEVIVHGGDIRHPLGLARQPSREALVICFDIYKDLGYPLGVKKRIEGLRLAATDVDWSHGTGPDVSGPALPPASGYDGPARRPHRPYRQRPAHPTAPDARTRRWLTHGTRRSPPSSGPSRQ
jgi:uncharacterized protein (TIGR03083 family)